VRLARSCSGLAFPQFDVSFFRTLTAQGRVASGDVRARKIFHGMIARERKRSDDRNGLFVLLLIDQQAE